MKLSACSSISIHIARLLRDCSEEILVKLQELFQSMPRQDKFEHNTIMIIFLFNRVFF